jgi:hypothetical protein
MIWHWIKDRFAEALMSFGQRKIQQSGVDIVVDAMLDFEDQEKGNFRTNGGCLWHKSYDFPLAIRTCADCQTFALVDLGLMGPIDVRSSEGQELIIAMGFMRGRLKYEVQLAPKHMQDIFAAINQEDLEGEDHCGHEHLN